MNFNYMQEAIIVGISYSVGSKDASSRNRDYIPTLNKKWKDKTGDAKQHAAFIENSVFSYIEKITAPTQETKPLLEILLGTVQIKVPLDTFLADRPSTIDHRPSTILVIIQSS